MARPQGASLWARLEMTAAHESVAVVDYQLSTSVAVSILARLRDQWPQAHRLALAATGEQQAAARAAGAEAASFKGFQLDELGAVLEQFK